MYKVFINEKKLSINNYSDNAEKNLAYEGLATIEIAIDLLENTSCQSVNIYDEEAEKVWEDFCDLFLNIEAAGGIVKNEEGKILFIYRLGKWDLPKGKLEPEETLEKAAVREVEEETGLNHLMIERFIGSTFHIYKEKKDNERVLKTTYWYSMKYKGNEKLIPQTEEGITQVEWKDEQAIQSDVLPNTFKNIQLILREAGAL
ncbi:MAG: NUDIX domain-containing protein [Cloacibacterium sp.]|nr:NUDIX domain-containing protein [Cloacibacterium sp.]